MRPSPPTPLPGGERGDKMAQPRLPDAALLVVRSGVHDLKPLQWSKRLLEQSDVRIAGVVLNALSENLNDWASADYVSSKNRVRAHLAPHGTNGHEHGNGNGTSHQPSRVEIEA